MALRSIPPANRQPLRVRRLSSMRAATATGFTMVGAQSRQPETSSTFRPNIVRPAPQRQGQREIYLQAIRSLANQLDELIAAAAEPGELEFWQARRSQLKGI